MPSFLKMPEQDEAHAALSFLFFEITECNTVKTEISNMGVEICLLYVLSEVTMTD